MPTSRMLLPLMIIHCAASLLHFVHNAVYLHDYPNLPPSLTAAGVYWAWVAITAVGVIGYTFYRRAFRKVGLTLIGLYAVLGFGGLDHYVAAPVSAHTVAMNATILIEVATAAALLALIVYLATRVNERSARPL